MTGVVSSTMGVVSPYLLPGDSIPDLPKPTPSARRSARTPAQPRERAPRPAMERTARRRPQQHEE